MTAGEQELSLLFNTQAIAPIAHDFCCFVGCFLVCCKLGIRCLVAFPQLLTLGMQPLDVALQLLALFLQIIALTLRCCHMLLQGLNLS